MVPQYGDEDDYLAPHFPNLRREMTRSTIAVILAIVAGIAAMVVFMDADHPVLVLAGGLLVLAVGLIVAVAS